MTMTAEPQMRIDEKVVESRELEALLEERAKAKEKEAMAKGTAKGLDERAKAMLDEHLVGEEAVVRVGRFRVTKKSFAAKDVSFVTSPSSRVRISTIDE